MDKVEISIRTEIVGVKISKAKRFISAKVLRQNYPGRPELPRAASSFTLDVKGK